MMRKQKTVSSRQMATLFLSFLTGSSIVNIPAPLTGAAKNAAWMSLWMANGVGMLLLCCILYLHRKYPELTLIQYSQEAIGRILTVILVIPFFLMANMMLANVVVDIGGFFKSTMMRETPTYVFHFLILFTAAMTVRSGIEVMARMFTLLLITIFIFSAAVILMTLPSYRVELLMPLFPHGFKPVLHGAYIAYGFPYAELILFSMVLPFVRKDQEPLGKFMFAALLTSGLSLTLVIVCTIMALGPMSGNIKFSLFTLARLIELAEIIERVESVIGMTLIAGSYMKASIILFVINLGVSQLFRLPDEKTLIFPLAFFACMISLTLYRNELEAMEHVGTVWPLFITVTGVVPILLLTIVTALKSQRNEVPRN
ncbi:MULTISPECIES: endospore germination permease [unclassified Paenibacillus]|uniref:GerAB/ArcD/ProY family transporter n=1 Tax=unclassified Paenibacillus TaxID=185978 RepID=UPI0027850AFA|nr:MULTISPECIES: endospore germination permease [unclassified Paenibacillus]MDQ0900669.1 spore germination protein KB [Paenibacillus sp. V4I7]MDQ0920822.1 spore germination protein KB [Paenibacillus sp. V4I5]